MSSTTYRYEAFVKLGEFINNPANQEVLEEWADYSHLRNNWFVPENVLLSIKAIGENLLNPENLKSWLDQYESSTKPQKVGVVMAGNIPAVGFHDALCVLISGHTLLAKLSKDDEYLMRAILHKLVELSPEMEPAIEFVERINDADAYIATGSDNTARYFEYYFSKKPHIIRKNRTSVAILEGGESSEDLKGLGEDVLRYYGLGCRNVSKVFVPKGYDFHDFFQGIEGYQTYAMNHHKFFNNYEYNKSILLINGVPHFDNGFLMLQSSDRLVSPLSVLFFEEYEEKSSVIEFIQSQNEKIQCVVSGSELEGIPSVPFGKAQSPGLMDYADGVDVMKFLSVL